ncbi:hypothetical protein LTR36_002003 [Oleoguttula mirabilis]|uniref:Heme oxygenase n=1 Tax=Oleoguttula mirabilis TaxID=1507867 RepID=A0AAV9JLW9_9PEZI|nr:hypothetical protein LTR36_002003 [Oleoguttula mirabilis]
MAMPLPSPAPSPPPEVALARPSISAEINTATRKQHTELNRLIIERLPLALPPIAQNPALLDQGLAAFAHIFFAFEGIWQSIEDGFHSLNKYNPDKAHEYDVCSTLAFLRPSGLTRSERLRRDLEHIAKRTGKPTPPLGAYEKKLVQHIRDTINSRPHVLLAYAWVMYMAIFSGGRWIRQQFANAGPEFWTGEPGVALAEKQDKTDVPGFSFLSFEGEEDGEDLKADFKARLVDTEVLLTDQERQEVIDGAHELFDHCIQLVGELDRKVARRAVTSLVLPALLLTVLFILVVGLYWFDNYGYMRR